MSEVNSAIVVGEATMNVDELKPAVYNPRKITGQQFKFLKQSIKENGILSPLIVNRRTGNTVVSGHQRLKAAQELGIKEVPVKIIDVDEAKEKVLNLGLNKIGGAFDTPKLEDVMKGLLDLPDLNLQETGFTSQEIDKMLIAKDDDDEEGEYPITPYFGEKYNYALILTKNEIDWTWLCNALELRQEKSYKSSSVGIGHAIDFERFKKLWQAKNS
nr:MAG TPA: ParB protein [Caudoviricetes sp.]